jgi:hypothetical protein
MPTVATAAITVPIGVSARFASGTPIPTAALAESPAPVKSGPQQQPAESSLKVSLLSFTPMAGTPGGKNFKIATLTFKIEASAPVTVTEASFYVDSVAFDDGPVHNAPITLLIHTGIFLGPPGTKVDPGHPIQRTVWLKSQENLFPNWLLAYNKTVNATFRWVISGQPVGGSVVKPVHKAWSAEPEVRRAEPVPPDKGPAGGEPDRTASPSPHPKRSPDADDVTVELRPRQANRTDPEPTILLKVPR